MSGGMLDWRHRVTECIWAVKAKRVCQGRGVNSSTLDPSGRPKWETKTTLLAPFSKAYLMVGNAPSMRW
eukprot:1455896-Amphidinium_carterae.1